MSENASSHLPTEPVGFDLALGFTMTDMSGDAVRGTIDITPRQHQPYGIVHGGVFCSVVETAASVGGALWFGDRGHVVGVSNTTNFLRAVREGQLQVEATPLHRGRTQQLWQVFIHDENEKLIAKGEVRLANITEAAAIGAG